MSADWSDPIAWEIVALTVMGVLVSCSFGYDAIMDWWESP